MAKTIAKMRKLPPDMRVMVTIVKTPEFRFRMWIGKKLISLAIRVWGCQVEFADKSGDFGINE